MGCVNSLEKSREDIQRTQTVKPKYKKMDTAIDAHGANFHQTMEEYQTESKIYRKGSIKKVKSGQGFTDHDNFNQKPQQNPYFSSDNLGRTQSQTYKNSKKITKETSLSNNSTMQSYENGNKGEPNWGGKNKQNLNQKNNSLALTPQNINNRQLSIQRTKSIEKRISQLQLDMPLPTVYEVSQQQIESAILRSAAATSMRSSKSYSHIPVVEGTALPGRRVPYRNSNNRASQKAFGLL